MKQLKFDTEIADMQLHVTQEVVPNEIREVSPAPIAKRIGVGPD